MITQKQFVEETVRVINENPDFVYPNNFCSYLKANTPCVFGKVLSNFGVSQEYLSTVENDSIGNVLEKLAGNFSPVQFQLFDRDTIVWACKIQAFQDDCYSWGDSLRIANEKFKQSTLSE